MLLLENFIIVTPCQFVRQRPTFWESEIQFPHIRHVRAVEALSMSNGEVFRQTGKKLPAISIFGSFTVCPPYRYEYAEA